MPTTIQVSDTVKKKLENFRLFSRETYNDVIERLIEDSMELSEKAKEEIEVARKEVKQGRFKTHEQLKKEMKF